MSPFNTLPLWVNACFLMAFIIILILWAALATNKKPTPKQSTPDEWLIEELQRMDGTQVIEINATQTVEVTAPALVVIVKRGI